MLTSLTPSGVEHLYASQTDEDAKYAHLSDALRR